MPNTRDDGEVERLIEALARREAERLAGRDVWVRAMLLLAQLDSAFIEIDAVRPHIVGLKRTLLI